VRRLFLLVAAVVLVDTMFYAAITPLLPTYRDELGLSKTAAGVLSGSYAAGTLLGSLPVGAFVARFGAKRVLLTGLALMSSTSLAFGFADDIVLLDAARFVQGIGGACSWGAGLAWLIGAAPPDRRGELIGAAIAAAIGGVLLGPVLGGAATVASPELVFSFVALLGAGLAVSAFSTPAPPSTERSTARAVVRAMVSRPVAAAFWLAMLPSLYSGTLVVLGPLRLDEVGAGSLAIGGVFLVAALFEGSTSAVVGRISDRRGRRAPIRVGLIAAAALAVVLPLPEAPLLLAVTIVGAVVALAAFCTRLRPPQRRRRCRRARPGLRVRADQPRVGGRTGLGSRRGGLDRRADGRRRSVRGTRRAVLAHARRPPPADATGHPCDGVSPSARMRSQARAIA